MKRYNMNLTCKGLYNKMSKNEINFDCAVQRGLTWDNERKSLLIHSILYGYSIPAFYMTKNEDKTYDSLDGKQRSNAIYSFINNEFNLSTDFPIVFDDDGEQENFSGMSYESLPEWAQDRIKDYNLTIYYYEDMTEEEIREFFRRLNNGKPLSAVELTRVKAKSIDIFQKIAKHEAIQSTVTEKGKTRFNDENMAMQIYAMAYMENISFETKEFRPYIQEVVISNEQKEKILNGLNYVKNCLDWLQSKEDKEYQKVLKKLKSRTHFVSMSYFGTLCYEKDIEQETFNKKVYGFYNTNNSKASSNPLYNETVGAGSAKQSAVQKRKKIVESLL